MGLLEGRQTTGEVIHERRRIKAGLAKAMDFDVRRILEEARRRQGEEWIGR